VSSACPVHPVAVEGRNGTVGATSASASVLREETSYPRGHVAEHAVADLLAARSEACERMVS